MSEVLRKQLPMETNVNTLLGNLLKPRPQCGCLWVSGDLPCGFSCRLLSTFGFRLRGKRAKLLLWAGEKLKLIIWPGGKFALCIKTPTFRTRPPLKRRMSGVIIQSCDIVRVFSRPTRSPVSTPSRLSATPASPSLTPRTVTTCREDAQRPWLDRLYQRLDDAEGESKLNL